jgi:diadenylate cyclase
LVDAFRYFIFFRDIKIIDAIDIAFVTLLIYRILLLVRGTRAWRITIGILGLLLAMVGSAALKLNTLHWLLEKAMILGPVALVILFLPELRQAIEGVGRLGGFLQAPIGLSHRAEEGMEAKTVEDIVAACSELAQESVGALIVIEKAMPLEEVIANGVLLNAVVSAPLLDSIFFENNPLHDGAVIIRGDTIVAAACRLPLSENARLDPSVHMRHRAAVGVTESQDCLSIVVSEERGTISIAMEGRLRRLSSHLELREILNREFRGEEKPQRAPRQRKSKSKTSGRAEAKEIPS